MKRHAPATMRNSAAIADVLRTELPDQGGVLEIASGSGEHAIYFAREFPQLIWHPSDYDPEALESIRTWTQEADLGNIASPAQIDAAHPDWIVPAVDAIFCCNMIHISPWFATVGLFNGSSKALGQGAPLIVYGPFLDSAAETAPSNVEFDASLKSRNPGWGLRNLSALDQVAAQHGFTRTARYQMPANNLILVFRRQSS